MDGGASIASRLASIEFAMLAGINQRTKKWAALQRPECVDFRLYVRKLKNVLSVAALRCRCARSRTRAVTPASKRSRVSRKFRPEEEER
ncbi:hypothetical protein SAMN06265784_11169 [Paraburkholderia susongensis]|uniref:Uncharacterized protein n=1 Tax=Paraburkholderia susongensis TaxID=1515439 RepID=A0A1X7LX06_9BURK|nr:hypothetical protein SAMN06265784_11169 [Paraburkholderia susongensis]